MTEILKSLFHKNSNSGSKSNVMNPLIWILAICIPSAIFSFKNNIPFIGWIIAGILILMGLAFAVAFFYCLFNDPDLLRSEKYNLEKTALEKMVLKGDSVIDAKLKPPGSKYVIYENPQQLEIDAHDSESKKTI